MSNKNKAALLHNAQYERNRQFKKDLRKRTIKHIVIFVGLIVLLTVGNLWRYA